MSSKIVTEQEFPIINIFEQMISNTHQNFSVYSQLRINKEYLYHRKNIFNILHRITSKMGFKSQVFYLSANYLDILFSFKTNIKYKFNIYTLALSCLCLSAKFFEIDPIVPQLNYFIKIYNNIMGYKMKNPLSLRELKYAEVYILKLLNYKLNYYTIYDFNSFLFIHGIIKSQLKNNNYNSKQIMEKIYKKSRYYLDAILTNTKLCIKYDALFLSIVIIEQSIKETLNKINKDLCFSEIMKNMFNLNYESNEQYQKLILDEEIKKIFDEHKDKNDKDIISNKINNKKIEEKKGNNDYEEGVFNKTALISNNKFNLNFDINKFKEIYRKIDISKSISKEKNIKKTLSNFHDTTTKKEEKKQDISSYTSRNELNNNLLKYCNKTKEKDCDSKPKIIYSKYTYNGDKFNYTDIEKKDDLKNANSSVEFKNKDINLIKYILTSQKKRNKYKLKIIGKSFDKNKSNEILYQKKLMNQNMIDNYKTISSFVDDFKKRKVTYGVIKMNSKETKKENFIEANNKNELNSLQKNNFFKKINYNKLINNIIINRTSSVDKNKDKSINKNNSNFNPIDKTSTNKLVAFNNINNFKNMNESTQTIITKTHHLNIVKESDISKEKTMKNFNIHKYQKHKTNPNQIQNYQKINNPPKNKLSCILGMQNTNLNKTLKEINIAYAKDNNTKNRAILKKGFDNISNLPNKETINFFKTQKDYFYKIKHDKKKEEIFKNQQDKRKDSIPNTQHEKISSSTIVINNNININIENRKLKADIIRYNKVYKKNKIMDMKSKNYFIMNNRNTVNGVNDTFYKSHLYTKTLENDFVRKRF